MEFPASPEGPYEAIAPPAGKGPLPVLLAGAATTAAALALHHVLLRTGVDVMGFSLNFLLPVGALLLGLIATIGFGVAAWQGGRRIDRVILLGGLVVLLGGYLGGEVFEFNRRFPNGQPYGGRLLGFWGSYQLSARQQRFSTRSGRLGSSAGDLGLVARGMQVALFVLGGLAAPLVLRKKPYCATCSRYRRSKSIAVVPAGLPPKVFGNNSPERVALRAEKAEAAQATLRAVLAAAAANDGAAVADRLQQDGPAARKREAGTCDARLHFDLHSCERCGEGELVAAMLTGQGKQIRRVELSRQPVKQPVTEALRLR